MLIELNVRTKCTIDMSPQEAFAVLCHTLDMDFVLDEDKRFSVEKSADGDNCVYVKEKGELVLYDERGDLFASLRNVAVNMFPNLSFRSDPYICNR